MDLQRPAVHISLFGKPALFIDGSLRPFRGPRKAIALLAYILLHRDRSLSRPALAELFWPDEDDASARAALRRHLHRALSALPEALAGQPWVIGDKVTLRWNPDVALEVDTDAYERLTAAGQRTQAAGLYRGDYLEDFYDHWVLAERERLRELHCANIIALIEERRRDFDYPAAIAFAQGLLRLDPLREDAVRRLMSLRFAAGDRSGALADFETFRRLLRDELMTDPMPETIALREAIRSNDARSQEDAGSSVAPVAQPAYPFVGRGAALDTLVALWKTAARGGATTALVSGEAGIGKSRLISELAALAETQGGRIIAGTTASIESEPYQAVAEALRGGLPFLQFERISGHTLAALSALVPSLREMRPDIPLLPEIAGDGERLRFFDAVETAFAHIAEKRPLLVILEDLHWAGAASVELLASLVRRMRDRSIFIVVSFREEEVGANHPLRAFVRHLDAERSSHVALAPLGAADIRTLVESVWPQTDGEQCASDVFAASDGNALFATELLRERLSGLATTERHDGAPVPAGIAATVVARLAELSASARAVVEAAAVIGVGFEADAVREVCGWSYAEVFDGLDELMNRALVRLSPHRRGDYAFSHQLVHAAVLHTLDDGVRRTLHRRVAKALERLYPDRPSLCAAIARHMDAAGSTAEAIPRYLDAARYALAVFAHSEAIELATRGLALSSAAPERFELHLVREEASTRVGDDDCRRTDCEALLELAEHMSDEAKGIALLRIIARTSQRGERDHRDAAIVQLRDLGERTAAPRWILEAALARAGAEIDRADNTAAEAIFAAAEPRTRTVGNDALALRFWLARANIALGTPRAREYLERARLHIGNDATLAVRWLRGEANVADHEGDTHALFSVATELLQRYREMGDVDGQASANLQLALCAWYRLDFAGVRAHNAAALAFFERVHKPKSIAAALNNRGVVAQRFGDFTAAEADYRRARAISESVDQRAFVGLAMVNLASLASMRGEPEEARRLASEAIAYAREHRLDALEAAGFRYLGIAEQALGEFAVGCEHLEFALRSCRTRDYKGVLETLVDIIPARLSVGADHLALEAAAELLLGLEDDRLRVNFPAKALAAAAAACAAAGDAARAASLRAEARELLRSISEHIPDAASREGYLALPFHAALARVDAVDARETVLP